MDQSILIKNQYNVITDSVYKPLIFKLIILLLATIYHTASTLGFEKEAFLYSLQNITKSSSQFLLYLQSFVRRQCVICYQSTISVICTDTNYHTKTNDVEEVYYLTMICTELKGYSMISARTESVSEQTCHTGSYRCSAPEIYFQVIPNVYRRVDCRYICRR